MTTVTEAAADRGDWREGFNQAVLAWLKRTLPERRPHGDWAKPVRIVSIEEKLEGDYGTDLTPTSPEIWLTVTWIDEHEATHCISEVMTLTELMKELT